MKDLSNSLVNKAERYSSLEDSQKKNLLNDLYNDHQLSWAEIAKLCGTYANKVRRDAKKLEIKSRDKSEAQKSALQSGRHSHPTKGTKHTEETKIKISESVAEDWDKMTKAQRDKKREEAKKKWDEKSEEEIRKFRQAAGDGVRRAAKEGSALEHFLLNELIAAGYKIEFHKKQWVGRENLEIDLYFPELNVALEVDGPSHFKDIWGADNLAKNKQRDNEKSGLLLARGCVILRVRQEKALSNKYKRDILASVLEALQQIKRKKPEKGKRHIILGEN